MPEDPEASAHPTPHGPNRLAGESSPYLRQHAHNPVDWYPWGEEALSKARREDKPLLVSIGYAACHWCHVMERESFEDPEVAAYMNAAFVNIKIDREERPDLDHIYMESVQAMTGSGGWPLNVFCTPDGRPFSGGTYFPPESMPARPSWRTILQRVARAFGEQRSRVEEQADLLINHLQQRHAADQGKSDPVPGQALGWLEQEGAAHPFAEGLPAMAEGLLRDADTEYGGFGQAPKFPSPHALRFQLRYGVAYQDEASIRHALASLDAMARGGIHDHLGGGFARYATDRAWLVPHFEKMLYDNALLLSAFSEAAQAGAAFAAANANANDDADTGTDAATALNSIAAFAGPAKGVVRGIVDWAVREMRHPDGGFYATLDADSADEAGAMEEGAFYTWKLDETRALLGEEASLFAKAYGLRQPGWWEGRNILYRAEPLTALAGEEGTSPESVADSLRHAQAILFEARSHRPRPGLDNKVILAWNALFCSGLFRAQAAFQEPEYGDLARAALDFVDAHLRSEEGTLQHVWQEGRARFPAYLDDLAAYACACVDAADAAPDHKAMALRLRNAEAAMQTVLDRFSAGAGPWFYYTPEGQDDVVARTIDRYDGATPSANALAADALLRLGRLLDRAPWTERGLRLLQAVQAQAKANPGAFGYWGCSLIEEAMGREELVCVGAQASSWRSALQAQFRPGTLYAVAANAAAADARPANAPSAESGDWPLLRGRTGGPEGIFRCRNYACTAPVAAPEDVQAWGNP